MTEQYPSQLLERTVSDFAKLPGIGRKTALRFALHLLNQDKEAVRGFGERLIQFREEIKFCEQCHNISDTAVCDICANPKRDHSIVCVVEHIRNVMAIENTGQFHGVYHVLGGLISPIDGIGPNQLAIPSLIERVRSGQVQEVIFALSPTMEGDTTNFYLSRQIGDAEVQLSTLARGISIGDELEYADEVTLGRSIVNRVAFQR